MTSHYDPGWLLLLHEGSTTSNGSAGGTTIIDSALVGKNDFFTNAIVEIISGSARLEVRNVTAFNNVTGTLTVSPAFSAQIVSGVGYRIIGVPSVKAEVDAIQADIGDASASTLSSLYGILGNPSASLAATILDGVDARVNNPTLNALLGVADAAGRSINGNIGDFQAQANLQTLLAALGIPDVAAKPLYTCLVTDRLDHATYGLSAIHTDVGRQVSMMEFWSDVDDSVLLTTATTNVDLPSVVVADLPTCTIIRVVGMIKMRALNNTSLVANAINGAAVINVKKSTGAWAVDDVALINIPDNTWGAAASTKEGGMLIEGDNDADTEVDGNATYNLRFNGNVFVDANNLELVDVAVGLKVYFTA